MLIPLLHLTLPTEEFPQDYLRKILHEGQRMAITGHTAVKKYCRKIQPLE